MDLIIKLFWQVIKLYIKNKLDKFVCLTNIIVYFNRFRTIYINLDWFRPIYIVFKTV